jgi:hypothetical protein
MNVELMRSFVPDLTDGLDDEDIALAANYSQLGVILAPHVPIWVTFQLMMNLIDSPALTAIILVARWQGHDWSVIGNFLTRLFETYSDFETIDAFAIFIVNGAKPEHALTIDWHENYDSEDSCTSDYENSYSSVDES